eukprot:COSAG01_NODE_705_length_14144_cov_66.242862_13_plen_260_part_00
MKIRSAAEAAEAQQRDHDAVLAEWKSEYAALETDMEEQEEESARLLAEQSGLTAVAQEVARSLGLLASDIPLGAHAREAQWCSGQEHAKAEAQLRRQLEQAQEDVASLTRRAADASTQLTVEHTGKMQQVRRGPGRGGTMPTRRARNMCSELWVGCCAAGDGAHERPERAGGGAGAAGAGGRAGAAGGDQHGHVGGGGRRAAGGGAERALGAGAGSGGGARCLPVTMHTAGCTPTPCIQWSLQNPPEGVSHPARAHSSS